MIPHEFRVLSKWNYYKNKSKGDSEMLKNRLFFDLHALSREQAMFGNRASNCLHGYSYHVPGQWQGKFKEKLKVIEWQHTDHFLKQKMMATYLNKRGHHSIVVEIESNKWQLNDLQKLSNAKFFQMHNELLTTRVRNGLRSANCLLFFTLPDAFAHNLLHCTCGRFTMDVMPNYLLLIRWMLESKYSFFKDIDIHQNETWLCFATECN